MIYDSILHTIGRTPIVRVNHIAPQHVTIYVKCEFFNPLSSVKDRLAIAIIEESGLKNSHFTYIETCGGARRLTRTIGVRPMVPRMLSWIIVASAGADGRRAADYSRAGRCGVMPAGNDSRSD